MIIALITFAVLLAVYALVMWATGDRGPVSIMKFWDEDQGR